MSKTKYEVKYKLKNGIIGDRPRFIMEFQYGEFKKRGLIS